MKLSENGRRKAFVVGELLDDPDFEQSDFEDAVVLTRKEARELIDLLSRAEDQRQQPYSYDACDEWTQLLTNRIEQSEMSKLST